MPSVLLFISNTKTIGFTLVCKMCLILEDLSQFSGRLQFLREFCFNQLVHKSYSHTYQ